MTPFDPWRVVVIGVFVLFAIGPGFLRRRLVEGRIGRDAMLMQPMDTAHGCAQILLAMTIQGFALLSAVYAGWPDLHAALPALGWPPGLPPDAWRALGAVLAYSGLAICWTAQGQMGTSWRFGPDREAPPALVTTGLFRFVRNPIYASMMLVVIGQVLLLDDAYALALGAVAIATLHMLVRLEEAFLREVHGEPYVEYLRTVPRFIPGLPGTASPPRAG